MCAGAQYTGRLTVGVFSSGILGTARGGGFVSLTISMKSMCLETQDGGRGGGGGGGGEQELIKLRYNLTATLFKKCSSPRNDS